ncbi:DedA family protein [Pseudonocardia sp.]|uniref:DedA family protein n=1 Tax=Pseudonocardia sp. TaxID=60912 RepID=UPI002DAE0BE9|nr:DedA family protein [Pseudonocardia sp.]
MSPTSTLDHAVGPLAEAGPVTVWIVVLAFVFLECAFIVGMFLPGDTLLLAAGVVLAQSEHEAGAWTLGMVAAAVAVAGNQVGYLVGRYAGTRMLARREGRILNRANLARAAAFFDRWGFWAIVVARWVPWVRTLAPMIAGAARMDNRRYIVANAVGAICWVPTLIMLGYYGAGLLDVVPWLKTATTIAAVAFFVVGTGYGLYRYHQEMRRPVDDSPADPVPAGEDQDLRDAG